MIDRHHDLSITQQASLLGISRSSVYYLPRPVSEVDLAQRGALQRGGRGRVYDFATVPLHLERVGIPDGYQAPL